MSAQKDKLISFKDLYAKRREQEQTSESQPPESQLSQNQPQESQLPQSQLPKPPEAGHESQLPQSQPRKSQPSQSQLQQSRPRLTLLASLPEVKGHMEIPHQVTDHLLPHLDPFEQAVYVQLYRLSWGHKSNKCRISNDRLAERTHMSVSKVKKAALALEGKGLVKKLATPHGLGVVQGVEYEVFAPSWQLHRSQLRESQLPQNQLSGAPNKEKNLKENNKGKVDTSDCPDCFGTGMWYPEGFDKGVARCGHLRLRHEQSREGVGENG